jgi:HicA toxin of bacterial toxin-antitoxin,
VNNKHQKTLKEVFSSPTPKNIEWRRVEALLMALGCELIEGNGSRVAFIYAAKRADFHRQHPNKEAKPYQVKAVAEYLILIGMKHEHDDT